MWRIVCLGLLFSSLLFNSCNSDDFNIGRHLVDPHVRIIMTDTITIRLSNVAIDSVITSSGSASAWYGFAGSYNDPAIGKLSAQSYIEFSRTTDSESNKSALFDSVMLVLLPNGNYYGDTTKYASLKIFKLVEEMEMGDDGNMYSTSSVPVGEKLTDAAFRMKPSIKTEEVEIRLPDDFGDMLFKGIRDEENYLRSDEYIETFPGLSISAGENSSCVYGFGVNDTSCLIRIYYSISSFTKEQKKMEFKPNSYKMFYRFESEKSDHLKYTSKDEPVPSSETLHKGILMSGTPMYARIEFPYLNNFLSLAEIVIIKEARLFIKPVFGSYDTIPLPPKLNIFRHEPFIDISGNINTNYKGSPLSQTSSYGQQTLDGNLPANWRQQLTPYYSFDITDYISDQLGKWGNNIRNLNVAIPTDSEATTIQRLLFGDQKFTYPGNIPDSENQIQLRIVYVTYND